MTTKNHADLGSVVQFQSIELSRLVKDNKRLNDRIDQLLDDIRGLRELQRRDQRLRAKELALREKDQALHQTAHESIRDMIDMAFILPKQPQLKAPARPSSKGQVKTEAAPELAAIHRSEAPEKIPAAVQQPLFSERYRPTPKNGDGKAAWPEIPEFLRRTA